jgi:hypothetical protein
LAENEGFLKNLEKNKNNLKNVTTFAKIIVYFKYD